MPTQCIYMFCVDLMNQRLLFGECNETNTWIETFKSVLCYILLYYIILCYIILYVGRVAQSV